MSINAQRKIKPFENKKHNVIHVPKSEWVENKKPMFRWADNQAAKHGYTGHTINVLKELISCTDQKGVTQVTLKTIYNRLISHHGKAAPSLRTIDNCMVTLISTKTIKRTAQKYFKSLINTRLLLPKLASRSTQKLRTEYISQDIYDMGSQSYGATHPQNKNLKSAPLPVGTAPKDIDVTKAELGLFARERAKDGFPLFGAQREALAYLEVLESQGRVRVGKV